MDLSYSRLTPSESLNMNQQKDIVNKETFRMVQITNKSASPKYL